MLTNRKKLRLPLNCHIELRLKPRKDLKRAWKRKIKTSGKKISDVPFLTEKEDYLWRQSTISERIFRKITFPFDFKPKFPDFLAK